ncbi:flagellar protein FlgN [Paenibacillus sp. NPDC057967]|uniref:flagellar protein FlgN n=1 Tax=Paenibacillus sp. NPDC057967 TaxID=3346293 RepID=UPI0036DC2486
MTIQHIADNLNQLSERHEQLIESGLKKKQAIISKDLDTLMRIMRNESKLIKEISLLDDERASLSRKLMIEKGVKHRFNMSFKQLMSIVFNVDDRLLMQGVHRRLEEALIELRRINEINQALLNQSLDFIQFSIELFISPEDESYTYKRPTDYPSQPRA